MAGIHVNGAELIKPHIKSYVDNHFVTKSG